MVSQLCGVCTLDGKEVTELHVGRSVYEGRAFCELAYHDGIDVLGRPTVVRHCRFELFDVTAQGRYLCVDMLLYLIEG